MQDNTQPDHLGETTFDRRRALRLLGGTGLGLGVAGFADRGVRAAVMPAAVDSTIPTASEEIPDETGRTVPR